MTKLKNGLAEPNASFFTHKQKKFFLKGKKMNSTLIFYTSTKEHTVVFNTVSERFELVHSRKTIGDFKTAADAIEFAYEREK